MAQNYYISEASKRYILYIVVGILVKLISESRETYRLYVVDVEPVKCELGSQKDPNPEIYKKTHHESFKN